jgi:hypothetical protein
LIFMIKEKNAAPQQKHLEMLRRSTHIPLS